MLSGCIKDVEKLIDCEESSLYEKAHFKVGVAVSYAKLIENKKYNQIVYSQFNNITPEFGMKPAYIHPEENFFNWDEGDRLVDFCIKNNKNLHGHTLIWHNQLPAWMENYQGDWQSMFRNHIISIVGRYKGKIHAWDVVNEAFEDDGTLRNSIWKQHIGDNYISLAFKYAREADPEALLFYNDHSLESKSRKKDAVLKMLQDFKAQGIPIDGIGIQMHVSHTYPTDRLIKNIFECFCETELKIHVSELDVVINPQGREEEPTFNLLKEQKKRIKTIVEAFNQLSPENKYGISLWGVSDADSWIRKEFDRSDWPLLYDDEYRIKPAYCGFIEGLEK